MVPPVLIKEISFNFDPLNFFDQGFNIQKKCNDQKIVPNWRADQRNRSEAAYVQSAIQGNALQLMVKFQGQTQKLPERIYIQAIDNSDTSSPPYVWVSETNILKDKNLLDLTDPQSFHSYLPLSSDKIANGTIQILEPDFRWQFRLKKKDAWQDLNQVSKHRFFTVLSTPNPPWVLARPNPAIPSVRALKLVCKWASGINDPDDAATKITEAIYDLGKKGIFKYDSGGLPYYTFDSPILGANLFHFEQFIDRIEGKDALGPNVNCTDCAAMVSTMANLVGCQLYQSRIEAYFKINPMIPIGWDDWSRPADGTWSYHEVAWKNTCNLQDVIWDACTFLRQVGVTGEGKVPVNLRFGDRVHWDQYLLMLTTAGEKGSGTAFPNPITRKIRTLDNLQSQWGQILEYESSAWLLNWAGIDIRQGFLIFWLDFQQDPKMFRHFEPTDPPSDYQVEEIDRFSAPDVLTKKPAGEMLNLQNPIPANYYKKKNGKPPVEIAVQTYCTANYVNAQLIQSYWVNQYLEKMGGDPGDYINNIFTRGNLCFNTWITNDVAYESFPNIQYYFDQDIMGWAETLPPPGPPDTTIGLEFSRDRVFFGGELTITITQTDPPIPLCFRIQPVEGTTIPTPTINQYFETSDPKKRVLIFKPGDTGTPGALSIWVSWREKGRVKANWKLISLANPQAIEYLNPPPSN